MKKIHLYLPIFLLLLLVSCGQLEEPQATAVPTTATTEMQPTATEIPPTATAVPEPTATEEPRAYLDPTLPTEERVEDLLARMTIEEKIGQMTLIEKGSLGSDTISHRLLGAVLSGGGGSPSVNSPEAWVEMVSEYQDEALSTRLGIPLIYGIDSVHGHSNLKGAVIFPHNIGLGATRNADLVEEIGRITAVETLATGIPWIYSPVLAVVQDIRWGRTYESYGEDPDLVGELGTALLKGLQGEDLSDPTTALATVKHFVGDGGTQWGTGSSNYKIDQGDTIVSEAVLREIHLAPYFPALDAGAQSVMASYSSWNGEKLHGHDYLLNDVLKGEMAFDGFIVSDWKAIDQIDGDFYNATVKAINAGIDMNMVPYDANTFIFVMETAVANGDIPEERVDDAVRRILTAKFDLGLFENPYPDPALLDLIGSDEHRTVAQEAVSQSLVLLQHENEALPIAKDATVFVAGAAADDIGIQSGGWTIEWQGKEGNITEGTTILQGLQATGGDNVYYDRFGKFEDVDGEGDVGIVVLGEKPYAEGRGDAVDLNLSEGEVDLIQRMGDRVDKLVVILLSGRPLIITDQLPLADAWIAAWLPGTEGQGVADNLYGDHPFTGKLSVTWPASMEQLPLGAYEDEPLFPYGYGLTLEE